MKFLSQTRFPKLYLAMQRAIGGSSCKQRIIYDYYKNEKRILEVGCSVGNVTDIFRNIDNISYLGIDIDKNAVDIAKIRFGNIKNFNFICDQVQSIQSYNYFDYIIIGGMLHHINNYDALSILIHINKLISKHGKIIIYDPIRQRNSKNLIVHLFTKYCEQGKYVITIDEYKHIIEQSGIIINNYETRHIFPDICPFLTVAQFSVFLCYKKQ